MGETVAVFERFTDRSRRVLLQAQEEAHVLGHNFIGTEHILLGLIHEGEGVAAKALESFGISLEPVQARVMEISAASNPPISNSPPFTPRSKKVLELSLRAALNLGHNYIGTEHILLGLVREGEGVAAQVLQQLGVDLQQVRQRVIELLSGYSGAAHDRLHRLTEQGLGGAGAQRDPGPAPAVGGDSVVKADIPLGAAALLGWEDARAVVLSGTLIGDARLERAELDGVVYEICTYHPLPPPEVSLLVAGAIVSREAFDAFTNLSLPDAEPVEGLGEAATYSVARQSLRVLSGTTLFVVNVRRHAHPKEAAIEAARRALANIPPVEAAP